MWTKLVQKRSKA